MIKLKSLIQEFITHHRDGYYYRIHPKGDIYNIIKYGLDSYSPSESPASFIDAPEIERWPDQDDEENQTYRFYVATSEWDLKSDDRIKIRIPKENLDRFNLEMDSLNDYYIDTGNSSEKILDPNQYDIKLDDKWMRADTVDPIMLKYWREKHYKPSGFYGNKFYDNDDEEENSEDDF